MNYDGLLLYWAGMGCGIVHKDVGGHRELHMPPVMVHHSLFYFGPLLVLVVAHSDLAFMTAKCCQVVYSVGR